MSEPTLTIHKGDILTSTTEAIVNPANSFLNHAGGLAAIIDRAATKPYEPPRDLSVPTAVVEAGGEGPVAIMKRERAEREALVGEWHEDHRHAPLLATGNAHITRGGALGRPVIHAVGPIWNGGNYIESDLLDVCMANVCEKAIAAGIKSIAVPAISCGIFGFPVARAALVLTSAAYGYASDAATEFAVEFWLFEQAHVEAFQDAFQFYGLEV